MGIALLAAWAGALPLHAISPAELAVTSPGGLAPDNTPMFVVLGSDDNSGTSVAWYLEAVAALCNPDGRSVAGRRDLGLGTGSGAGNSLSPFLWIDNAATVQVVQAPRG
jgi:hypothetical protein